MVRRPRGAGCHRGRGREGDGRRVRAGPLTPSPSPGLAVRGLGLRHPGGTWALRGVDLDVAAGEVVAVVGPSGSGKTSLLRVVCGLSRPTEGTVALGGVPQQGVAPEGRPVAMVFQGYALFPHLTVRDNVAFGLRVRRVGRAERARRVERAAAPLGLLPLLDRLPVELSGGERQRVALARALVRDPLLFCLDEPLSALDPLLRREARRELARLLRAEGRCALLVTHDQDEAVALGDRVAVLRDGAVEQVGTPRELYEAPATPFVARFLGSPPAGLLEGDDGVAGPLRLSAPAGPCTLGVRPEHLRLVAGGDDADVVAVEDHGHEVHVVVQTLAGPLVARGRPGEVPRVGARVGVVAERVLWWPREAG